MSNSSSKPIPPTSYIDPEGKSIKKSFNEIKYMPNKKFTIVLLIIFLLTAVTAIVITNYNYRVERDKIMSRK